MSCVSAQVRRLDYWSTEDIGDSALSERQGYTQAQCDALLNTNIEGELACLDQFSTFKVPAKEGEIQAYANMVADGIKNVALPNFTNPLYSKHDHYRE
ncbi:hypothetical protein BGX23_010519 [Mortierella sp. AD031]|nr:hypothetical protein BGX23_010519 [Mortierella sp. AD031]